MTDPWGRPSGPLPTPYGDEEKAMARYAVETLMVCNWENCWTEDDEPLTFSTIDEARDALNEFLNDVADAAAAGFMSEGYNPDDYRIVELKEGE